MEEITKMLNIDTKPLVFGLIFILLIIIIVTIIKSVKARKNEKMLNDIYLKLNEINDKIDNMR